MGAVTGLRLQWCAIYQRPGVPLTAEVVGYRAGDGNPAGPKSWHRGYDVLRLAMSHVRRDDDDTAYSIRLLMSVAEPGLPFDISINGYGAALQKLE